MMKSTDSPRKGRPSARKIAAALTGAVLAATALAACGSDESGQSGDNKTITLAVSTKDLNIGYPYATLPLKSGLGFFSEEGLNVKVIATQSSAQTSQLLLAGKADLGVMTPDTAVTARVEKGVPLTNVYPLTRVNDYSFAVLEDSPVKSVADLKGKTVGHGDLGAGTVPYAHARYKDEGFDASKVKELSVGYGASSMQALESGKVATFLGYSGMWTRLRAEGYKFRLLPAADWQNKLYGFSLYATDEYVKDNPSVVAKVGRSMAKATIFLATNPEAGVKIFWDQYPERAPKDRNDPKAFATDLAILKTTLESMSAFSEKPTFAWGSQSEANWEFMGSYLRDAGLITKKANPNDLYDDSQAQSYMDFDVDKIVEQAKNWKSSK